MKYSIETNDDGVTVELAGKMGFEDNADFRSMMSDLTQKSGKKDITFDLQDLDAIDSAGLGMLLLAADMASNDGWKMKISGAHGDVEKMIKLTHVDRVVEII